MQTVYFEVLLAFLVCSLSGGGQEEGRECCDWGSDLMWRKATKPFFPYVALTYTHTLTHARHVPTIMHKHFAQAHTLRCKMNALKIQAYTYGNKWMKVHVLPLQCMCRIDCRKCSPTHARTHARTNTQTHVLMSSLMYCFKKRSPWKLAPVVPSVTAVNATGCFSAHLL